MLVARQPIKAQFLLGLCVFVVGIWIAWQLGDKIVTGDFQTIALVSVAIAGCWVALTIIRTWRTGFYMFLAWLLFEDLVRKYLGNNIAIYFAKDILVALVYISFFIEVRRGREKLFRPKFLFLLWLFVWLGAIQIFNQNSPHILYGLLGFKLYFYYIPLMYVSYALIRTDEDLKKFLLVNLSLAGVISSIGIAQAILGHSFLNPTNLASELRDLGELNRYSPITNQILSLPTAVFVSSGRFGMYLIIVLILAWGAAGYLMLSTDRYHKFAFAVIALVGGAAIFSGSRGALVYGGSSTILLLIGFLWGAPWRWRQAHRMVGAIRNALLVSALGFALLFLLFPSELAPRVAFYTESLDPYSPASEVNNRAWSYPIQNLVGAFGNANWVLGNGIGTASLGGQYVARVIGAPELNIWVEEGYGLLIIEMGIVAPLLFILWTGALVLSGWRVVKGLRQTRFFPIGFALFWYIFLLLFPLTYEGFAAFQNFVSSMYLWVFVGILFRLPEIQAAAPSYFENASPARKRQLGLRL